MAGSQAGGGAPTGLRGHATEPGPRAGGATFLRRAWGGPLWSHALVLAFLLLATAPLLRLDVAFTIDEGAYGLEVRALEHGSWEFDYRGETVDPEGRWLPLYHPTRGAGHWYPYVKHPAYPMALLVAARLAGDVSGPYLLALSGAVGVAVAAWLLAAEVAPGASRGAFWLAAGGPAAVNAYLLWAHAPSAALAGFATIAGLRLAKGFRPVTLVILLLCVAAGVLVRAEGLLFAGALALGLALAGLRGRPWAHRSGIPAACAAVALGTAVLETRWQGAIVGRTPSLQGLRDADASPVQAGAGVWRHWAGGRLEGAWSSLFQGSLGDRRGAGLVAAALVALCFAAWVAHRRRGGWRRDAGVAVVAATAAYALRLRAGGTQPITGLLAAWPAALLGLAVLPRRALRAPAARFLAVVSFAFALAVVATQYRIGGGREWGGRFFFPVLAPLAVLACLGLRHLSASWPRARGAPVMLVVALVLLPTLTGLSTLREARAQEGAIVDEVTSSRPALVVTHVLGLPPFAWKTYPGVGWMSTPPEEIGEATARLRAAGVPQVTVLGPGTLSPSDLTSYPVVDDVTGPEAAKRGWRTLRLSGARS